MVGHTDVAYIWFFITGFLYKTDAIPIMIQQWRATKHVPFSVIARTYMFDAKADAPTVSTAHAHRTQDRRRIRESWWAREV